MERTPSTSWNLLAGTRFVLAAVVVFGHVRWLGTPTPTFVRLTDFCPYTAVVCFLIISGYSISHSIETRPDGFLTRRFARIYPLYALSILAALVPGVLLHLLSQRTPRDLVLNLFMLEGYRGLSITGNGVTWTLTLEAGFYLITPMLRRLGSAPLIGLAAASALAFVAYPRLHLDYYGRLTHGLPMLFLGWAWLAGFIYYRWRARPWAGTALLAVVIALMAVNPLWTERWHEVTAAAALLTVAVASTGETRVPQSVGRVLAYLGDLSYPLYLFHAPVILVMADYLHVRNPWVPTAVSAAVGAVMLVVDRRVKVPFTRVTVHGAHLGHRVWRSVSGRSRHLFAGRRYPAAVDGVAARPVVT